MKKSFASKKGLTLVEVLLALVILSVGVSSLMMAMSVIVAIMGLSANSPALVIGAMLIAPLMTPVLGIAASIAMALTDAVARSVATVLAATVGAIAISYLIAGWLPGQLLTGEVLARTAPDARDLVVAETRAK